MLRPSLSRSARTAGMEKRRDPRPQEARERRTDEIPSLIMLRGPTGRETIIALTPKRMKMRVSTRLTVNGKGDALAKTRPIARCTREKRARDSRAGRFPFKMAKMARGTKAKGIKKRERENASMANTAKRGKKNGEENSFWMKPARGGAAGGIPPGAELPAEMPA